MTQHTARLAWRRLSVVASLAMAALALTASPAFAAKGVFATIGEDGVDAGQFTGASGVALNQATGDLYVADVVGQRIEQFDASGGFVRAWGWGVATGADALETCTTTCLSGIQGVGDGQFSFQLQDPSTLLFTAPQLAIDQTDGSVYVVDGLNNRVQKFTASGGYVDQFDGSDGGNGPFNLPQGVAVAPSGDVYVADTNGNRVVRVNSDGDFQAQLGTTGGGSADGDFLIPTRVAVDSTGRLYVVDFGNGRVQRFTAADAFDQVFAPGAYNGPLDIGVDPGNDHVYIAGANGDFSVPTGILEFDVDGTAVDVHAANGNITVGGIAVPSGADRFYAANLVGPSLVLVLDEVTPPTVTIASVTDITDDGAVFHGTVNPQGDQNTRYRFEYSTDGVDWTAVPSQEGEPAGSGSADVDVSETVSGLDPNVEYRVRLIAFKDFNAGTTTSSEETFRTAVVPPLVRSLAVGSRTATTAWLGAEVNPQNLPTEYYVEYTLADDVGYTQSSRVPAAPQTEVVGDDNAYVVVRQLATGLQPDTAYRFRVVATNAADTTNGPDGVFTTRKALPQAPPGRAYEMVSPLEKNGADIDRNLPVETSSTSGASTGGDAVAYAAQGQFAGIESGSPQGQYRSVRTPTGWTTRGINPPIEGSPVSEAVSPTVWALSEDLTQAVVGTNSLMTPDASLLGGSWGLYLQDNSDPASSAYRLLSLPTIPLPQEPPPDPLGVNPRLRFSFAGATKGYDRIVLESQDRQLTLDAPATGHGIYEWADGQMRFISRLPSGDPANTPTFGARNASGQFYPGDHAISEGGERIFFTDDGALYVRENDNSTLISAAESATSVPETGTFQAATAADGSLALFTSLNRLTSDAAASPGLCRASDSGDAASCHDDLYLWDASAPANDRLTDLTTADTNGGGVLGVAAVADDLSPTYFVASGVLADGGVSGRPNLYVWTGGDNIEHLATLSDLDTSVWNVERDAKPRQFRDARLSADGNRLVFSSHARLTAADNAGHRQVYLYDLSTDRLVCVSCPGDGAVADGDAWLFYSPNLGPNPTIDAPRSPLRLPRNLSDDGTRVFFGTDQGLLNADSNGKADVYMWEDGGLTLVSTGKSDEESEFIDASASGNDIFFTTRQQLVGADVDDQVDVYDARVGGGFPEQKVPLPCVGDGCQGPPTPKPTLTTPSPAPESGNPPIAKRASFRVATLSSAARRALARGSKVSLTVRVNKAGRVTGRGTARIGKQTRTVMTATKRARGAGRVKLPLRLSKAGRQRLARTGALRISLSVRFSGADEARVLKLALTRPSNSGRGR